MAPRKTKPVANRQSNTFDSAARSDESQDQDDSASHSQEFAMQQFNEKFRAKNLEMKKRHREREKANLAAHRSRVKQWQEQARVILHEHEQSIRAIERHHVHRLIKFRQRKRELQHAMNCCVSSMEKVVQSAMGRLRFVIKQRLE